MGLDKRFLLQQLHRTYQEKLANAKKATLDAQEAARTLATESEKKEDGRAAIEFGSLATGQAQRIHSARIELQQIEQLYRRPPPVFGRDSAVSLMALVDVELTPEDGEAEERTFLMLPMGAGSELKGPGGDGFLSVITPASPVGKALLGKRRGDSAEVQLKGGVCEIAVIDVS